MAQADEMGEGEGRDDGFVDGLDPITRRRSKKRPGMDTSVKGGLLKWNLSVP